LEHSSEGDEPIKSITYRRSAKQRQFREKGPSRERGFLIPNTPAMLWFTIHPAGDVAQLVRAADS